MRKKKIALILTALTVGMSSVMTANAMLSEEEQKAAYIEKAVREALSSQTEEMETESSTQEMTEEEADSSEAVTESAQTAEEVQTEIQTEAQTEVQTEAAVEDAKEQIIIAIDPSHQLTGADLQMEEPIGPGSEELVKGFSDGAIGTATGLKESELNLSVAEKLKAELEERGYQVYLTREGGESELSQSQRAQKVNASGAQALICLHANSTEENSEKGVSVLAPSYENPFLEEEEQIKKSNALAYIILQSYCEKTGLENKGLYNVDNQTLMNWSEIPVMMLEMGFMSNSEEDGYMAEEDNQQLMAEGIADGIDLYFGRS